jgi:hypothetical protein
MQVEETRPTCFLKDQAYHKLASMPAHTKTDEFIEQTEQRCGTLQYTSVQVPAHATGSGGLRLATGSASDLQLGVLERASFVLAVLVPAPTVARISNWDYWKELRFLFLMRRVLLAPCLGCLWLHGVLTVDRVQQRRLRHEARLSAVVVLTSEEKKDRSGVNCRSAAVNQVPRSAATCNCFSASERI